MQNAKDKSFSPKDRAMAIQQADKTTFDLIVIGGGITGAGIALDASLRGLKVLLIEKRDFASGTSSKSTKLIHGGLRYLKQFELGLVRETGLERRVAHNNIPHLVHPETMILPIVENGEFNKFTASLAIFTYDLLAKVEKKDRKRSLSKSETLGEEPLINEALLKSSIAYSEYRTDDARLTMEIIKAARREGAVAFNYMNVNNFLYNDKQLVGVECIDAMDNTRYNFMSQLTVSATGPWVDKLRKQDKSLNKKRLHLTKGVHIVIPKARFPLNNSVYFDDFEGRMIFAIPRGKVTYIGTSDTNYDKDLNRVLCSAKDVAYLLSKTNKVFPTVNLTEKDVISSWAGLRPLIHEDGKSPSELSRKDEIFVSESGLISIAGGKLTGFRKMSRKIVDKIIRSHDEFPQTRCKTKHYKLHVDSFANYKEYEKYTAEFLIENRPHGLDEYLAWHLVTTYGKNASVILQNALSSPSGKLDLDILKSEIEYCIHYEAAIFPWDYFNRRSGRLYFDIESVIENFDEIHRIFSDAFNWSEAYEKEIRKKSRQLIDDVTIFAMN